MKFLSLAAGLASTAAWTVKGPSPKDATLSLQVGIKHEAHRLQVLEKALISVSDPDSISFGKHLTKEAVEKLLVTPTVHHSAEAVSSWLREGGLSDVAIEGDVVTARGTVAQLEALLGVRYFEHVHGEYVAHRCIGKPEFGNLCAPLPEEIAPMVDYVAPTSRLPSPLTPTVKGDVKGVPDVDYVTPAVIKQRYGVDVVGSDPRSRQMAAGFLGQYASPADLATFFQMYYPAANGEVLNIVGPNNATQPGIEADLDVQYIMSVGANITTTYEYTDGLRPDDNEPFLTFLTNLGQLTDAQLPKTVSVSYGDNENTVDIDYAKRVNVEFIKLGARGVSFMFSSGDGGVSGSQSGPCPGNALIPTFPAASPFVTAVGGTTGAVERAAGLSAGGFSNYWSRPYWQTEHVAGYFNTVPASQLPNATYNKNGAGFPDVAAFAVNFNIVYYSVPILVDGTSCAAPTFTGIVSLLNDLRLKAGKKSLGFLNVMIYKNPQLFNDITEGSNPGCGTNGFPAAKGWDPVTGLGSPNFQKLKAYVLSLP